MGFNKEISKKSTLETFTDDSPVDSQGVEIKSVLNMIYEKLNKKFIFDESSSQKKTVFNLNINKIYNQSNWKPSISIWDGISLLIQDVKFENNPTLEQFTKRIRSLYK